ncbi:MAG TPA: nuclear transport factor 2 family protein [Blastocatellia bacterium]|nr:nuclear transport factor 2 family protein [Blastocatellia bacterium]
MKTTLEIEVEAANLEFYKTFDSGSLEDMERIWLHEDWVRCVHPGWDVLRGWRDIRESWGRIFGGDQKMKVSTDDVSVCRMGELALVTCLENIIVFEGADFDSMQAVATNVFVLREGKWLMAHHHASAIPLIIPDSSSDNIQ